MRWAGAAAVGVAALCLLATGARADRVAYFSNQLEAAGFKVRLQAAFILGTLRDKRAAPALVKALGDSHYAVRATAAMSLGVLGEPRVADALVKAIGDEEAWVRSEVAKALGRLRAKDALPALVAALEDPDWKVRFEAARALGRLGDKRAVLPLARALESKVDNDELREEARRSLRNLASVIDLAEVTSWLKTAADKHHRARAAVVLGALREKSAVPSLIEALGDKESYVRAFVARALASVGDSRALGPLRQLLASESDARVRGLIERSVSLIERKLGKP